MSINISNCNVSIYTYQNQPTRVTWAGPSGPSGNNWIASRCESTGQRGFSGPTGSACALGTTLGATLDICISAPIYWGYTYTINPRDYTGLQRGLQISKLDDKLKSNMREFFRRHHLMDLHDGVYKLQLEYGHLFDQIDKIDQQQLLPATVFVCCRHRHGPQSENDEQKQGHIVI